MTQLWVVKTAPVCLLACVLAASVCAQVTEDAQPQGLDEIVVTAQKRNENLQTIPLSVSALNAPEIAQRGILNVEDLARAVPGFSVGIAGGVVEPFIRGVGTTINTVGNETRPL